MVVTETDVQMRRLGDLLAGLVPADRLAPHADATVTGVCDDSRRVQPGAVFVAVCGTAVDARKFIADAVAKGARYIVGEQLPDVGNAVALEVADARVALATLAFRWFDVTDAQSAPLQLIGITGTNGKSTSAFMTRAILRAAGRKCGMFGTVHYDLCGRNVKASMTTPGALELAGYLAECKAAGADAAVMEVSSHALDQRRTCGLRFAAAAFTNLTGDHLDYHKTLDNYRAAKARLFEELPADATAVVNRDDPSHAAMIANTRARVLTYGLDAAADINAQITKSTARGTFYRLRVGGQELVLENAVVGRHNVYNALTAAGLAYAVGISPADIATGLTSVRNVPGRLQRVPCEAAADVFVDYAHTDDALRNVVSALKPLAKRRLIVLFGCGGDRDRTKRPRMAKAAIEGGDLVIVTSDNPRTEEPQKIIDDILPGFATAERERVLVEPDRAAAIRLALTHCQTGDIVLIAGKGHEDYQILGTNRIHFDDVEVAIQVAHEIAAAAGERAQ